MSTTNKTKELTHTVTEKYYQKGLAKGWTDDDMLRPGTYKVQRARHINKNAKPKQRVTMYLDADILEFFKNCASEPNAAPYQSQINQALRLVIESKQPENKNIKKELLEDQKFLQELKERLAA